MGELHDLLCQFGALLEKSIRVQIEQADTAILWGRPSAALICEPGEELKEAVGSGQGYTAPLQGMAQGPGRDAEVSPFVGHGKIEERVGWGLSGRRVQDD